MATSHTSAALAHALGWDRARRLQDELGEALERLNRQDLARWAAEATWTYGKGTGRRAVRLGRFALGLGKATAEEAWGLVRATGRSQAKSHLRERARAAEEGLKDSLIGAGRTLREVGALMPRLASHPAETAPLLFGSVVGFLVGSGGLDADGGVPDLDLAFGVGHHRSIFTHSVLAGAAVEAAVLAMLNMSVLIHDRLPADHDPLWDDLLQLHQRFASPLTRAVDLGIAYHLAADATWQGMTPYKDLPVSLPMTGHTTILGANAAAEALHGMRKDEEDP